MSVKPNLKPSKTQVDFDALDDLFEEIARTYQCLVTAAEQVHKAWDVSAGQRGILRMLHKSGPQTVPQMARTRCVSRQFIQTLVNPMLDSELVELQDNPAHLRSKLVSLTPKGTKAFNAMEAWEQSIISELPIDLSLREMRDTMHALQRLRKVLEGPELTAAADSEPPNH